VPRTAIAHTGVQQHDLRTFASPPLTAQSRAGTLDVETPSANLTFTVTTQPSHGTLTGTPPNLVYHPASNYFSPSNQPDTFRYTVTDRGDPDNCGTPVTGVCTAAITTGFVTASKRDEIAYRTAALYLDADRAARGMQGPYTQSYLPLGDLYIAFEHGDIARGGYRRQLDLRSAVIAVRYRIGEVNYSRDVFASYPDQVIVGRLTADKPGAYTGSIELTGTHGEAVVTGDKHGLMFSGALDNGERYEAQLRVVHDGGTLQAEGESLAFRNCNSLTFFLAAGTDYAEDRRRHWKGDDPHARVTRQADDAERKPFAAPLAAHDRARLARCSRVTQTSGQPAP